MARQNWKPGNMLYPLPAVIITSKYKDKTNAFTVAWCGNVCTNPPMVSISIRKSRYSYEMIKESNEFVINLVNESLLKAADYCGVKSGRDVDKFKECNFTENYIPSVSCPGILESPVNIACKVEQIIELGSHDLFIASVKNVNIDESLLDETNKFDLARANLISYSHGEYFSLGEKLGTFGYSVRKSGRNDKSRNSK
jgi:flavin reductase (DIM6/NTAB) family NADH-FMN oxidoreductase RutF